MPSRCPIKQTSQLLSAGAVDAEAVAVAAADDAAMERDYKDAALCVNCRMSRSALLLRLTGVGQIVLLSVKNKGNRCLLKLKLRY